MKLPRLTCALLLLALAACGSSSVVEPQVPAVQSETTIGSGTLTPPSDTTATTTDSPFITVGG